jgi:glycosyltransferase involved in cell wall biosynthesis
MHALPSISVVVPVYNAEGLVEHCMRALMAQDYPAERYEVLLVDNDSTDASAAAVRRHAPRVRLLTESKRGAYACRNRGVRESSGEIVAFTDADCAPARDWLRAIASELADPAVGVLIGRTVVGGSASRNLQLLDGYEHAKNQYALSSGVKHMYYGRTNNMAMRRTLLERFPFVERRRGGDTIFVRQVVDACSCETVRYAPAMRVDHLEIRTALGVLRKHFIYGRSRRLYKHISRTRPLTRDERVDAFRRTLHDERCSLFDVARLAGLLAGGIVAWNVGQLSASVWRHEW